MCRGEVGALGHALGRSASHRDPDGSSVGTARYRQGGTNGNGMAKPEMTASGQIFLRIVGASLQLG
eukprot:3682980-Prymnesium_polylepis.1